MYRKIVYKRRNNILQLDFHFDHSNLLIFPFDLIDPTKKFHQDSKRKVELYFP